MKSRNFAETFKNAMGTVFLLAGAFFVCSTLVSIRAVFADPIAPVNMVAAGAQSPRAANSRRAMASNTVNRAAVMTEAESGRGAQSTRAVASRAVSARTAVPATTRTTASTGNTTTRGVSTRVRPGVRVKPATSRGVAARGNALQTGASRNVVARTAVSNAATRSGATRNVRARSAVTPAGGEARVSLQGSAIRGSKRGNSVSTNSSYTYLSSKLYSTDYSNIVDSATGLISAEAYSTCMESYYTCMDEICTARNASQGRCSCANRTKAFRTAEDALEAANEELITVSGELALLVATKGKDVSQAFKLTDAEKIMNCAAYAEVIASEDDEGIKKWCTEHVEYIGEGENISVKTCSKTSPPTYCKTMGETYDFNLADLGGSSSDILASLRSWADAKDKANNMLLSDDTSLVSQFTEEMNIVSGMNLAGITADSEEVTLDQLANTWGYDLFGYAHNNVCGRVLDSCFNGIYEACGTPPNGGRCATSATSSCPYNYNSNIKVSSAGEVDLVERGSSNYGSSNSVSCFGYSTTTDPYGHLRGPVADARRSIMQKYLLDANAACDVYGEQLRTMAQNVGYQKVAAQQALQQKRMEFAIEEEETTLADAVEAGTNFDNCISEIYDCYETQLKSNSDWPDARIKTYCAQVSNVPTCYETMICNPSNAVIKAVIDKADTDKCVNSDNNKTNTCRNIVTLNDILHGTGGEPKDCKIGDDACNSRGLRQYCLLEAIGTDDGAEPSAWTKSTQNTIQTWVKKIREEQEKK